MVGGVVVAVVGVLLRERRAQYGTVSYVVVVQVQADYPTFVDATYEAEAQPTPTAITTTSSIAIPIWVANTPKLMRHSRNLPRLVYVCSRGCHAGWGWGSGSGLADILLDGANR